MSVAIQRVATGEPQCMVLSRSAQASRHHAVHRPTNSTCCCWKLAVLISERIKETTGWLAAQTLEERCMA